MKFRKVVLSDDSPCPINGKHKGMSMATVPAAFLDWFMGQPHLVSKYPEVAEYIVTRKGALADEMEYEDQDEY
jgi:hypothetical protein